jgi:hypothetical protein
MMVADRNKSRVRRGGSGASCSGGRLCCSGGSARSRGGGCVVVMAGWFRLLAAVVGVLGGESGMVKGGGWLGDVENEALCC